MIHSINDEVLVGAARALFVSSWADREEEEGRTYPGMDLMDVAPETPVLALVNAAYLIGQIEMLNKTNIYTLSWQAWQADRKECDEVMFNKCGSRSTLPWDAPPPDDYCQEFGHYLAMGSLGHGVSWFDDHAEFDLELPNAEYYP